MIQPTASQNRRSEFKRGLAKHFRANPTDAERQLWALLRSKQIGRLRFRRQQPIGVYIADFFCPSAKLIVELDGDQHGTDHKARYDSDRTRWLERRGYRVLRLSNCEFLKDKDAALARIWFAVEQHLPLPEPLAAVRPSLKGRVD